MLFAVHRYVDPHGRSVPILDRTRGLPWLIDEIRLRARRVRSAIGSVVSKIIPRMEATGSYVWRNGRWVKTGGLRRGIDIWMGKFRMTEDQGLREQHNMFVRLAQEGKLNEVNDREVWEESKRRYGKDRVWTGDRKSRPSERIGMR